MTKKEESGGEGGERWKKEREITRDLGQHTARPACQSSLFRSRAYSHILSFLSYSHARFLLSRVAPSSVSLPLASRFSPRAVIGVPNRNPSFHDRDASIVVLERGGAGAWCYRTRAADELARILAGRHLHGRHTLNNNGAVPAYLNLTDVVGYARRWPLVRPTYAMRILHQKETRRTKN